MINASTDLTLAAEQGTDLARLWNSHREHIRLAMHALPCRDEDVPPVCMDTPGHRARVNKRGW